MINKKTFIDGVEDNIKKSWIDLYVTQKKFPEELNLKSLAAKQGRPKKKPKKQIFKPVSVKGPCCLTCHTKPSKQCLDDKENCQECKTIDHCQWIKGKHSTTIVTV